MKYCFDSLKLPAALWLLSVPVLLLGCGGGLDGATTIASTSANSLGAAAVGSGSGAKVGLTGSAVSLYSVGGSLTGLRSGTSLVLRNNGGDNKTLSANGEFTFGTKLADAASYAVTVYTQPEGQKCAVTNASGTIPAANVINVGVACVASTVVTTSAATAKLLFKSNFGSGVSLGAPRDIGTSTDGLRGVAWQDIAGTDKETGYTWPISALGAYFSGIQLIMADPVTPSTIGGYITNQIRSVTGPEGRAVSELFQNVKKKGPVGIGGSQAPLIIIRPWTIGDVTDLYISYWFKYQADLASKLDSTVSSGNWRTQFEFKTGGYDNTYGGDYRIGTNVMKGADGALYWYTKGDNVANGPWPRVDYWVEKNMLVPVPVDKWFKFEVFWHRSEGSDGRYWAAVDGQVIADHHGPNMGDLKLPINRIMVNNAYSGGAPTVESHSTGMEIWDGFPCGVGKSCYVAPSL